MEKLVAVMKLLDHVYHGCKKGSSCIRPCVRLRQQMDHAATCSAKDCTPCKCIRWMLRIHSKYHCKTPWKCRVPVCQNHAIVVQELVDMGIDREFLEIHFHS